MYFLAGPLTPVLDALATWTGSFGIAIILLTLAVRLLLYPLNAKQLKSTAKLREIQPKLKELDKYKDNPEEYQKRMMALYQEHNMNPLGGCLPSLIQLPVLFGLYRVLMQFPERLAENPELQGAIDITFFGIDLTTPYWLMGVLAGLASLALAFSYPGDKQQRMMMAPVSLMSVVFGFILPAGLALYLAVSYLFSALQQYRMRSLVVGPQPAKKG